MLINLNFVCDSDDKDLYSSSIKINTFVISISHNSNILLEKGMDLAVHKDSLD